ncbi:CLUMA_CG020364, isoform A [Clunio marinus]|uniref:L-serine deaminase n=1 Tax=Clunio marinus TaxID=568069 RepID=A0A1J1J7E7_9DIPT|nr:CLUMA_CG020364, isoform A [Clunio marinus]
MVEDKIIDKAPVTLKEQKVNDVKIKNSLNSESDKATQPPESAAETVLDPSCDEKNPRIISFQDVCQAAFMIKGGIDFTPCRRSHLSEQSGIEIFLKKEFQQYTGSFKERGARNFLLHLTPEQKKNGVVSASLGNHALGLSYHGMKLKIPVTVVMPKEAPIMKVQKCRSFGAHVLIQGEDMAAAKKIAMEISRDKKTPYVNGYDHPLIISGQGTIGLEIVEQCEGADAIVVPVGGGGLIAGIATAIKTLSPQTKIIGVESNKCPSFSKALQHGGPVYTPNLATLADGLAVPKVGCNAYATVKPLLDRMIVVKEEWIALAILRLVEMEKCVVEGAGAAGLAAILAGQLDEFKGKKVVLLVCGGNIDTTTFGRCLERGLAAEGRLMKFNVTVSDRPGGITELCRLISSIGVTIKDIMHERAWLKDIYCVEVKCVVETADFDHSQQLKKKLMENYKNVFFNEPSFAIHKSAAF